MPRWSAGGAITPLYTMRAGSKLTENDPTIWTRTCKSVKIGQFKSTLNVIEKWEGAGSPRVLNMEEVIHPQPQRVPRLQHSELRYTNSGTRKDSDL